MLIPDCSNDQLINRGDTELGETMRIFSSNHDMNCEANSIPARIFDLERLPTGEPRTELHRGINGKAPTECKGVSMEPGVSMGYLEKLPKVELNDCMTVTMARRFEDVMSIIYPLR